MKIAEVLDKAAQPIVVQTSAVQRQARINKIVQQLAIAAKGQGRHYLHPSPKEARHKDSQFATHVASCITVKYILNTPMFGFLL
jgi:hypothetical protein